MALQSAQAPIPAGAERQRGVEIPSFKPPASGQTLGKVICPILSSLEINSFPPIHFIIVPLSLFWTSLTPFSLHVNTKIDIVTTIAQTTSIKY